MNQVLLTQLAHVRALSRRVDASSSAAFPAAFPAPSPATDSPFAAATLANLSARLTALEAMVERQEELLFAIRRHGSQWPAAFAGGDDLAAVFERIKQVSEMREEAEAARFERADEEREGKVAELDDKHDEMEEALEKLRGEREEDAHRFRQMRNLLVALSERDISLREVSRCRRCWGFVVWLVADMRFLQMGDRVRALDMDD